MVEARQEEMQTPLSGLNLFGRIVTKSKVSLAKREGKRTQVQV